MIQNIALNSLTAPIKLRVIKKEANMKAGRRHVEKEKE